MTLHACAGSRRQIRHAVEWVLLLGLAAPLSGQAPPSVRPVTESDIAAMVASARAERQFVYLGANTWESSGRARRLKLRATASFAEVASGSSNSGDWLLRVMMPTGEQAAVLEAPDGALEWHQGRNIAARLMDDTRGLHASLFASLAGPREKGAAALSIRFSSPAPASVLGDALLFAKGSQNARVRIQSVRDEAGASVPFSLSVSGEIVTLRLGQALQAGPHTFRIGLQFADMEGAAVLRPTSAPGSPDWVAGGFGSSDLRVATAGDVNGDGYSDIIVGVPSYDYGNKFGKVFVYYGGPSGLSKAPDWARGQVPFGNGFGAAIASAGDFNGDGYGDILVGAPYNGPPVPESSNLAGWGAAFLYLGSPNGLTDDDENLESTGRNLFSPSLTGGSFGYSVAYAGDVNGDGLSDIIIGAPTYDVDRVPRDKGAAFVWYGHTGGLAAKCRRTNCADWTAVGSEDDGRFGQSVHTAGDFDADGFDDVVIGAPSRAFATVYHPRSNGSTSVVATFPSRRGKVAVWRGGTRGLEGPASRGWSLSNTKAGQRFGTTVSVGGDALGQGYSGVLTVAGAYSNSSASDPGAVRWIMGNKTDPILRISGSGSVKVVDAGTVGDLNGDGFADVAIGTSSVLGAGQTVKVYPSCLLPGDVEPFVLHDDHGEPLLDRFAAAGDVNGDGFGDIVAVRNGKVFVYYGRPERPSFMPWDARRSPVYDWEPVHRDFGASVAHGDFNGDGFTDLAVGSPSRSNGPSSPRSGEVRIYFGPLSGTSLLQPDVTLPGGMANAEFGYALAVLDMDNDGFDDLAIGAPGNESSHARSGAVFIYRGASSGVSPAPQITIQGTQSGERLGHAVRHLGDVNSDGYADLVIGAPLFDDGFVDAGRAVVLLGRPMVGPTTLSAHVAAWSASGGETGARFGWALAGTRDVNDDGFTDLVVGAPGSDRGGANDGGAVYVWYGKAPGAPATSGPTGFGASGTPANAGWTFASDQEGEQLGHAVDFVGDLDGDGFSELAAGAPYHRGPAHNAGRVALWYGSRVGFSKAGPDAVLVGTQLEEKFGMSVASGGDVNADGIADLLIGAPFHDTGVGGNEGAVYLWYGRRGNRLIATNSRPADWIGVEPTLVGLGSVVTGGADLDADGLGDVIAGAPSHQDGRGTVLVFSVNPWSRWTNVSRRIQQVRVNDARPVSFLGTSDSAGGFRLRGIGRSAAGRTRVGLAWRLSHRDGLDLSGIRATREPLLDSGSAANGRSAVELFATLLGQSSGATLKWQAHFYTGNPHFPSTPWTSHPNSAVSEPDLRLSGTRNQRPISAFTASPRHGRAPLTVVLDASPSTDADGEVTSYAWAFDDGATAYGARVAHTFFEEGSHRIELQVIDDSGSTSSISSQTVAVAGVDAPPVPRFDVTSGTGSRQRVFDATASTDDVALASHKWDFGDGTSATGPLVTHTYPADGAYAVSLRVTDSAGTTSELTRYVGVGVALGSVRIQVHWPDAEQPDYRGRAAGEGIFVRLSGSNIGRTDALGRLSIAVPAGRHLFEALAPSFAIGTREEIIAAESAHDVHIVLDDGKEVTTPSSIRIPELDDGILAAAVDRMSLVFTGSAGAVVPLRQVGDVSLVEPIASQATAVGALFRLESPGVLVCRDIEPLKAMLARTRGAVVLEASGVDAHGVSHVGRITFAYGQHRLSGRISGAPSDPTLTLAGITVRAAIAGSPLVVTTVSDAAGTLSFPPMPTGVLVLRAEAASAGRLLRAHGTVLMIRDATTSIELLSLDEIAAGRRSIIVQP